ncbi:MAG TPA: nitric oxide synthase oxygenase [Sporichthyaceae bacterium]
MSTFVAAEAERFLRQVHAERAELGDPALRIEQARAEIAETGSYTHSTTELSHGARLAWRNNTRCIGRLYWNSLVVRDCRHVADPPPGVRRVRRAPAAGHQRRADPTRGYGLRPRHGAASRPAHPQ